MSQQTKTDIIGHFRKPYGRASKAEKSRILNVVIESTGYSRKHAIALLSGPATPKNRRPGHGRPSHYGRLCDILVRIWAASNYLCGKRLKPFLPVLVESLKHHKELDLSEEDEALILTASAATIDRLLTSEKKKSAIKGPSTTKPGTLLKHQIPIRTFAQWTEDKPGFMEVDLVAHTDTTRGEYINTLNMTDIATGWTASTAFMGKGERDCVAGIDQVRAVLPFPLLGIDSDNGSEFINAHLMRYCKRNSITFTRSRPYKKNDQAHIEQKNWDVVRKTIGYGRFTTAKQLDIIKRIESLLAFHQNYFQPSQKLISKTRIGARLRKKYDLAQTPAQRLIARDDVPEQTKTLLKNTFRELNPVALLCTIHDLVEELYDTLPKEGLSQAGK
jgi:hypothetical protein